MSRTKAVLLIKAKILYNKGTTNVKEISNHEIL